MKEDIHIDMSGKIIKSKTIEIAAVESVSKKHWGCAISSQLKKDYVQIKEKISQDFTQFAFMN